MKVENRKLLIEQLDRKIEKLSVFNNSEIPPTGWIKAIRMALNMSLAQLAKKLEKSIPTVREIEEREKNKNITLKKLMEVAEVLDLRFVYGFVPKEGSLEKMIDKKALEVARKIVQRTSHTMNLEDQAVSEERLEKAIQERSQEIKREIPRLLWD